MNQKRFKVKIGEDSINIELVKENLLNEASGDYDPNLRLVRINRQMNIENRAFVLFHELGEHIKYMFTLPFSQTQIDIIANLLKATHTPEFYKFLDKFLERKKSCKCKCIKTKTKKG